MTKHASDQQELLTALARADIVTRLEAIRTILGIPANDCTANMADTRAELRSDRAGV